MVYEGMNDDWSRARSVRDSSPSLIEYDSRHGRFTRQEESDCSCKKYYSQCEFAQYILEYEHKLLEIRKRLRYRSGIAPTPAVGRAVSYTYIAGQ